MAHSQGRTPAQPDSHGTTPAVAPCSNPAKLGRSKGPGNSGRSFHASPNFRKRGPRIFLHDPRRNASTAREFEFASRLDSNRGELCMMNHLNRARNYFNRAQIRGQRRKSPSNILLVLVCFALWLALAFVLIRSNLFLHQLIYPGETLTTHSKGFTVLLAILPLGIGSLPLGFLVGNIVVWLIPSIRRVLDQEARPFPETSFLSAQRGLRQGVIYLTLPCFALAALGTLLPW